jgi:cell shape-determining protein MreD
MKSAVLLAGFFFVLAILETSFFVPLVVLSFLPSLVLIAAVFIFFFSSFLTGLKTAYIAGFFLELFSEKPFGFWVILFFIVLLLFEYIVKRYVRLPFLQRV